METIFEIVKESLPNVLRESLEKYEKYLEVFQKKKSKKISQLH